MHKWAVHACVCVCIFFSTGRILIWRLAAEFYSTCKYIIDTNELANYLKICLTTWCYSYFCFFFNFYFYYYVYAIPHTDLNHKLDSPWKPISLLGWMIWPRNGKNTNGIFSDDDPLTNGASVHSVANKQNEKETTKKLTTNYQLEEKKRTFFFTEARDHMHVEFSFANKFPTNICIRMRTRMCELDSLFFFSQ